MKLPGLKPITPDSILYLEAEVNYTRIHFIDPHTSIAVSPICLKGIDGKYEELIRIHKSYLVNKQYIVKLSGMRTNKGFVLLWGGVELPVSKRRYNYVRESLSLSIEEAIPPLFT